MTVLDLIKSTLKLIGVVAVDDNVHASDANEALSVLNMVLGQWQNEKLLAYTMLNETFPLVAGTASYTIGTAGTFDTTRPVRIDSAFVRDGSIDEPLELIPNDKYQNLTLKNDTSTYPQYLNYIPDYPLATINLWPVPTKTGLYLGISQRKQLTTYTSLSTVIALPPGWEMALRYNLAMELAPEYGSPVSGLIAKKASEAKALLKTTNTQDVLMTTDMTLYCGSQYDITSDRYL